MKKTKGKILIFLTTLIILGGLGYSFGFSRINLSGKTININYFDGQVTRFKVNDDTTYDDLPVTKKNGYKFLGWSKTNNNADLVNLKDKVNDTKEIYAVYIKESYVLEIDPDGGTYDANLGVTKVNIQYGNSINLLKPNKDGFKFKEWKVTGTGSKIVDGKFVMGVENAKITAIYETKSYFINFDYNGGFVNGKEKESIKVKYNATINLELPTRLGYTFAGYITDGGIYKDGTFVLNVERDATLIAKWVKNQSSNTNNAVTNRTPVINKNDNNSKKSDVEVIEDNKPGTNEQTKPNPGTNEPITVDPIDTPKENSTLKIFYYLMDTTGDSYILDDVENVEFSSDSSYLAIPKNYDHYITPENVTITGEGVSKEYIITFEYDREKYKLTLNSNGGALKKDISNEYYWGQEIEVSIPEKDAYNFKTWDFTSGKLTNNIYTMPTNDVELNALYTPIVYNVTYELNGGTTSTELKKNYTIEDTFTLPNLNKEGYTFNGWVSSDNTTPKTDITITKSKGNLYFVASFTPITYEVLYIYNNGTSDKVVTYNYNETVKNLPVLTKEGSTFIGWFDDLGNEVTDGYIINRNNTFAARFRGETVENSAVSKIESLSSSSELEYDHTKDNNLRYVGKNPNNYVMLNNELWRIIGVFYNVSDSTGDTSAKLKLIRNDYLFSVPWSTTTKEVNKTYGVNDFETSDVKRTLNEFYYNSNDCQDIEALNQQKQELINNRAQIEESTSETKEEELSNIDKQIAELEERINYESKCNSFSSEAQEYAIDAVYSTGSNGEANWGTSKALDFYNYERSSESSKTCIESVLCNDNITRSLTSTTKVGLMYLSDYTFAVGGSSRNTCLNKAVYAWWDQYDCLDKNWMVKDIEYTMSEAATLEFAYKVYITGKDMVTTAASMPHNVRPVVYLNSKTTIVGGNGTIDNPFVLGKGW